MFTLRHLISGQSATVIDLAAYASLQMLLFDWLAKALLLLAELCFSSKHSMNYDKQNKRETTEKSSTKCSWVAPKLKE